MALKTTFKSIRFWAVVTGIVELALCCHRNNLFSTLEGVMRRNDYFSNQTDQQKKITYARLYTITSTLFSVFQASSQIFSDRIGQWKVRSIVFVLCTTGAILNALSTYSSGLNFLVWIGFPLFYGCGSAYIYSYVILMELYPERRGLVSMLIGSSYGIVFLLYLWYETLSRNDWFYYLLAVFQLLAFLRTFLFLPKMNSVYVWDFSDKVPQKTVEIGWKTRRQTQIFRQNPTTEKIPFFSRETFRIIFTTTNCLALLWFICGDIRANAFVSQVQPWLEWTCNKTSTNQTSEELQDQIDYWQNWYNYSGIIGIAINPFFGIAMDKLKVIIMKRYKFEHREAQAIAANIFMVIIGVGYFISDVLCTLESPGYQIIYIFLSMNALGGTRFITRSIFAISTRP